MNPDLSAAALSALDVAGLAAAYGTGLLFLQAGIAKLRRRALLPGIVANYRLLPNPLVAPVAQALPVVEILLGMALLASGDRIAVVAASALLLIFAGAMAINIARGRSHIDCGCGHSQLRQPLSWPLVWGNLALAAFALLRLVPAPEPTIAERLAAAAAGAGLFMLVLLFNALGALALSPIAAKRR